MQVENKLTESLYPVFFSLFCEIITWSGTRSIEEEQGTAAHRNLYVVPFKQELIPNHGISQLEYKRYFFMFSPKQGFFTLAASKVAIYISFRVLLAG